GGGKAAQSIWPWSLHASGERYAWDVDGEPARVAFADLDLAARKIAAGALLIRRWPRPAVGTTPPSPSAASARGSGGATTRSSPSSRRSPPPPPTTTPP